MTLLNARSSDMTRVWQGGGRCGVSGIHQVAAPAIMCPADGDVDGGGGGACYGGGCSGS